MSQVLSVGELGTGMREWRFVPKGWRDPFSHHRWFVVTKEAEIEVWKKRLAHHPSVTWFRRPVDYTAEVSYHPDIRPVLVIVGGFR